MAGGGPISFPLMEKKQKIKASQPGAKSSKTGYLQFEAVGRAVKDFKGSASLPKLLFAVVKLIVRACRFSNFLNAPFCEAGNLLPMK